MSSDILAPTRRPLIIAEKDGSFDIALRSKQRAVYESKAKLAWFVGGVGAGKTAVGGLRAFSKAVEMPKARGFIGANTYKQLFLSTLPPFMSMLDTFGMPFVYNSRPPRYWPSYHKLPRYDGVFTLRNGAQIYTYSLENYAVYKGIQIAWFWVDETADADPDAIKVLFERLRGFDIEYPGLTYQGLFTGTPSGFDYMYDIFAGGEKTRLPDTFYVQAPTKDNIANLPPGYVEDLEKRLGKKLAQQQLMAKFISMTKGKMFDFKRDRHVRDCEYNPDLPLVFSMDFNVAPMAGIVLQYHDNRLWVLDEICIPDDAQTRLACEEFARRWGGSDKLDNGKSKRAVIYWGDRAGGHRDTRGNESDLEIMDRVLRQHFVSVMEGSDRAQRFIVDGVNAVNAMLDPLHGEPRLAISPSCEFLIQDLEQMAWKPGTKTPDESDKQRKHFSDCLRYPCAQLWPVFGEIENRNLGSPF